jgi:hypothetical protein
MDRGVPPPTQITHQYRVGVSDYSQYYSTNKLSIINHFSLNNESSTITKEYPANISSKKRKVQNYTNRFTFIDNANLASYEVKP